MSALGCAHRADGATLHLPTPLRYAIGVGLLLVGLGNMVAIDLVLLPRYLAVAPPSAKTSEVVALAAPRPPVILPTLAQGLAPAVEPSSAPSLDPVVAPSTHQLPHLLFPPNTAWMPPTARESLEKLETVLKENPALHVVLSGHTDGLGSAYINNFLSLERARRASQWLEVHGIDPARIEIQGFGSTLPLEDNSSPQARAHNRRVEITLR